MKYQRKSNLSEATLDGNDTVLLDVTTSKYYDLNPVAARIWQLIEQPKDLHELCETLQGEFTVDEQQCQQQIKAFLQQMQEKGLCETAGD